jgi:hypothetical protein
MLIETDQPVSDAVASGVTALDGVIATRVVPAV